MTVLSSQLGWSPLPWDNVPANVTAASGRNFHLQPPADSWMQHQGLDTEESGWVLYREKMLQSFTGIVSIPGINKQEKGIGLGQSKLHLMVSLLKALKEKKLLVKKGNVTQSV